MTEGSRPAAERLVASTRAKCCARRHRHRADRLRAAGQCAGPLADLPARGGHAVASPERNTRSQAGGEPQPDPLPAGPQPSSVSFADATHGWVGVEDGILGTDNGGATWSRQLTAGRITKIWLYDATRAWALSADNTVYRTRDGGHWTAIPPTNPPIAEIDPFSPDLVWAIGVTPSSGPFPAQQIGNVLLSDDGGLIWRPVGIHTMWSVCFYSRVDGFGAEGKQIFRTTDAGRSWTPIALLAINDDGPYWYPTLTCPRSGTDFRVQVTEPNAALGHAPYLVYRTNDASRSWLLEFREGYALGTTTPPNTPGLGSTPSLIGVLPGGRTWFLTCTPAADSQEFRVVDATGALVTKEPAPFVACAHGASFADDQHGWAIATAYQLDGARLLTQGIVMRTTDGARTWSRVYP